MQILNFKGNFWNWNEKYTIYQKLCETTFIDFIRVNNFAFLRFIRILYIVVKNMNFWFSTVFFEIKKKNINPIKMLRFKFFDLYIVNTFAS